MPRRIEADDEVRRFTSVWLGPPGYSLPFHARYTAYVTGGALFMIVLLVEAITPIPLSVPPIWELCLSILATTLLMSAVDHDKPLGAVLTSAVNVARAPRPVRDEPAVRRPTLRYRIKTTTKELT